jgi:hypothetical protein
MLHSPQVSLFGIHPSSFFKLPRRTVKLSRPQGFISSSLQVSDPFLLSLKLSGPSSGPGSFARFPAVAVSARLSIPYRHGLWAPVWAGHRFSLAAAAAAAMAGQPGGVAWCVFPMAARAVTYYSHRTKMQHKYHIGHIVVYNILPCRHLFNSVQLIISWIFGRATGNIKLGMFATFPGFVGEIYIPTFQECPSKHLGDIKVAGASRH